MLKLIYRLNRWYDDLDEEHGVFRFFIAILIVIGPLMMIMLGNDLVSIIGLVLITIVAGLRISGLLRYPSGGPL